jgi:uncharacterized protein (TIGR02145 family)
MNKIEQIKELKLLFDSGILYKDQYAKLLNEIVEKSEDTPNTKSNEDTIQKSTQTNTEEKIEDFKSVIIGNQEWMAENLNVKTFRNGEPIPEASSSEEWEKADKLKNPAWCYYDDDPENGNKYGLLYNIYALYDSRGLAPEGWQIPSMKDYEELIQFCGGTNNAGRILKSRDDWYIWKENEDKESDNEWIAISGERGTNKSSFNLKSGGFICFDQKYWEREPIYHYSNLADGTALWTPENTNHGQSTYLIFNGENEVTYDTSYSNAFCYVRCIKKNKESNSLKLSNKIVNYEKNILETFKEVQYNVCKIVASNDNKAIYYEITPDAGFRISTIKNISNYFIYELSLKLDLSISDIKFITPIPGTGSIGVEISIESDKNLSEMNIDFEKESKLTINEENIQENKQNNSLNNIIEKSKNAIELKLSDNDLKIVKWYKNKGDKISYLDNLFNYEQDGWEVDGGTNFSVSDALSILNMENTENFKGIITNIFLEKGEIIPNNIICIIEPDTETLN